MPGAGNPQALNRYSYVLNNPVRYNDPSGHWVDTVLDVAGIVWDLHDIHKNGLNWSTGLALAVDVVCVVVPLATGGGALVRAASHADEVADIATHADEVVDAVRYIDEAVSGLHPPLQDAITAAARETGSTIAVRGRPPGAYVWDGIYDFKPQGTETLEDLGQGLRKLVGEGDKIYVSDLDIAWVERGGEILPNEMVYNPVTGNGVG